MQNIYSDRVTECTRASFFGSVLAPRKWLLPTDSTPNMGTWEDGGFLGSVGETWSDSCPSLSLSVSFPISPARASDTLEGPSGLSEQRTDHRRAEAPEGSTPAGLLISLMISYYQSSIIPGLLDGFSQTHKELRCAEAHLQVCTKAFTESLGLSVHTPHISRCHSSPPGSSELLHGSQLLHRSPWGSRRLLIASETSLEALPSKYGQTRAQSPLII